MAERRPMTHVMGYWSAVAAVTEILFLRKVSE